MLTVAPNALEPLVDVPTPRCTCRLETLDAKSPMLTQYTAELSESLTGIPFDVMLIRVGSVPRTRKLVYPIPFPASLVVRTDGVSDNK